MVPRDVIKRKASCILVENISSKYELLKRETITMPTALITITHLDTVLGLEIEEGPDLCSYTDFMRN